MKKINIPMSEVLDWLLEKHPALHPTAEADRAWLWLTADLKGDHNQAIRDSINHEGGFRFAKRGHVLPSGKVAYWGHSCSHPMGFKRKDKGGKGKPGKTEPVKPNAGGKKPVSSAGPARRPDPLAAAVRQPDSLDALAAAFV